MLPKKNTLVATLALLFSLVAVPRAIAGSPSFLGSNLTPVSTPSVLLLVVCDQQLALLDGTNSPLPTLAQNSPSFPRTTQNQLSAQWWGFLPILAIVGLVLAWYRSQTPQKDKKHQSDRPATMPNVERQISNKIIPPQTITPEKQTPPLATAVMAETLVAEEKIALPTDSESITVSEVIADVKPEVDPTETQQASPQSEEIAPDFPLTAPETEENDVELITSQTPSLSAPEATVTAEEQTNDPTPEADNSDPYPSFNDTSSSDETPANIEAAKFNLGQTKAVEPRLASVDEGLAELPDGYGKTKIVLMPREPNSAYAYWDIPNADKEKLRQLGGEQLALRFYDVTGIDMDQQKPHSVRQYDCEEMTREWYIEVPTSDRDYIVEIGYMTEDGHWLKLARSLHVRIPPVYPCDWYGDDFKTVHWDSDLRHRS
ncbi:MAG: DUF4912 domain-containing protein [Microcoleaceae cyanobacterium]